MLRQRQVSEIQRLVRGDRFEWTILVLDDAGREVLAPLFTMAELGELGVVQCVLASDQRDPIEEARAVYVLEETRESIDILLGDLALRKYRDMRLVFTGSISRPLLEALAVGAGRTQESARIKTVHDGLIRLSVLGDRFFSLNIRDSFCRKGISEQIIVSLLSLTRHLGAAALFASPTYRALAEELGGRIKDLGLRQKTKKKTALLLLGRDIDLITPVEHGWTYGALINDVLQFDLNKVTIRENILKTGSVLGAEEKKETKVFDLNRTDTFWEQCRNEDFPAVAEKIEQELGDYKADLAQRSVDASSSKEEIASALGKAPALAQKNKIIHTHMTICLTLVEEIKKQRIDELFGIENDAAKMADVKDELEDLAPKITTEHLLRTCAVLASRFPEEKAYLEALASSNGCSLDVIRFLTQNTDQEEQSRTGSIVGVAASSLLKNIKKMLPRKKRLPVVAEVENLLANRSDAHEVILEDMAPGGFSSIHVFMLGGGTFTECRALENLAKERKIEITYGATEILTPTAFLARIQEIAR